MHLPALQASPVVATAPFATVTGRFSCRCPRAYRQVEIPIQGAGEVSLMLAPAPKLLERVVESGTTSPSPRRNPRRSRSSAEASSLRPLARRKRRDWSTIHSVVYEDIDGEIVVRIFARRSRSDYHARPEATHFVIVIGVCARQTSASRPTHFSPTYKPRGPDLTDIFSSLTCSRIRAPSCQGRLSRLPLGFVEPLSPSSFRYSVPCRRAKLTR